MSESERPKHTERPDIDERPQPKDYRRDDEPFELFNGFSEIAIMVGLFILYSGASSFLGLESLFREKMRASQFAYGIFLSLALFGGGYYYSRIKRFIGPSNLLTFLFAMNIFTVLLGYLVSGLFNSDFFYEGDFEDVNFMSLFWTMLACALSLFAFWKVCRVPFALFFVVSFAFAAFVSLMLHFFADQSYENWDSAYYTVIFMPAMVSGVIAFILAMRFDLRDRLRKTRGNKNAFWLHAFASTALINVIAWDLLDAPQNKALILMTIFILFACFVALVIDRRVFLLSCTIYIMVVLGFNDSFNFWGILSVTGAFLVVINTWWTNFRYAMMEALPNFRGKACLYPWKQEEKEQGEGG